MGQRAELQTPARQPFASLREGPSRPSEPLALKKKPNPRRRKTGAVASAVRHPRGSTPPPALRQRSKAKPPKRPWQIGPDDLQCLDAVRSLLAALNDAYVSSRALQQLVSDIPVLAARCVRRIGEEDPGDPVAVDRALTSIGNMGLEAELLGLLEDLTTYKADREEERLELLRQA